MGKRKSDMIFDPLRQDQQANMEDKDNREGRVEEGEAGRHSSEGRNSCEKCKEEVKKS